MIQNFKTFIKESIWSDIQKRSSGEITRKEDDINNLDFVEFVQYIHNTYEVIIEQKFFEIGSWWFESGHIDGIGRISIPIDKNNSKDTPNLTTRMLTIEKDIEKDEYISISPNKHTFRLYPHKLRKTFGDKYVLDFSELKIIPKDGIITNQVCVDVIDKLLGMVKNPILKKRV